MAFHASIIPGVIDWIGDRIVGGPRDPGDDRVGPSTEERFGKPGSTYRDPKFRRARIRAHEAHGHFGYRESTIRLHTKNLYGAGGVSAPGYSTGCPSGTVDQGDGCVAISGPRDTSDFGVPVMGLYGEGRVPRREDIMTLQCPPNYKLGKDEICYLKISNSNRKWPRGARPLGTPGEMAALAKAASFGRRYNSAGKRLKKIGQQFKGTAPAARRRKPKEQAPRQMGSLTVIDTE